jgi:hypothetical protein
MQAGLPLLAAGRMLAAQQLADPTAVMPAAAAAAAAGRMRSAQSLLADPTAAEEAI